MVSLLFFGLAVPVYALTLVSSYTWGYPTFQHTAWSWVELDENLTSATIKLYNELVDNASDPNDAIFGLNFSDATYTELVIDLANSDFEFWIIPQGNGAEKWCVASGKSWNFSNALIIEFNNQELTIYEYGSDTTLAEVTLGTVGLNAYGARGKDGAYPATAGYLKAEVYRGVGTLTIDVTPFISLAVTLAMLTMVLGFIKKAVR